MMRLKSRSVWMLIGAMFFSCSTSPKPIEYGEEQCHGCKMIISDQRFGAELVTTKGKVFKYDAIECMIPDYLNQGQEQFAHVLITDFTNPGHLVDATYAYFLISEQRPSPMGANLSGYITLDESRIASRDAKGVVMDWKELQKQFRISGDL